MAKNSKTNKRNKRVIIVGCGGIGGFLLPSILRTLKTVNRVDIIDKDRVEISNLFRQSYNYGDVGEFKASVLASRCELLAKQTNKKLVEECDWFTISKAEKMLLDGENDNYSSKYTTIISAVDNNPARLAMLSIADMFKCQLIIAGNHSSSFRAYYYNYILQGTKYDPRVRHPDMLQDKSDDPLSCQHVDQIIANPQTTLANQGAAIFATMIASEVIDNTKELKQCSHDIIVYEHSATSYGVSTMKFNDLEIKSHLFNNY